jgi:hypothetical protein
MSLLLVISNKVIILFKGEVYYLILLNFQYLGYTYINPYKLLT